MPNESEPSWLDYHDESKEYDHSFSWLTRYDLKPTAEPAITLPDIAIGIVDLIFLVLIIKNL